MRTWGYPHDLGILRIGERDQKKTNRDQKKQIGINKKNKMEKTWENSGKWWGHTRTILSWGLPELLLIFCGRNRKQIWFKLSLPWVHPNLFWIWKNCWSCSIPTLLLPWVLLLLRSGGESQRGGTTTIIHKASAHFAMSSVFTRLVSTCMPLS